MSTTEPHQPPTKPSRRSAKKSRILRRDDGTTSDVGVTGTRSNTLPSGAAVTHNNGNAQSRKPSHTNIKSQPETSASVTGKHGNDHHDKATSNSTKPVAYAGSTFQQSPAASALPLPSFYSKSLPATSPLPKRFISNEETMGNARPMLESVEQSPGQRETTPCDFLFEAARQARATPRGESPAGLAGNMSAPNASPSSKSPAPRGGDAMFPFELEGGIGAADGGPPSVSSYRDRMQALQSTRSNSTGAKNMDEEERRAKTDALKRFLLENGTHERENIPRAASFDANNPFNARAPYSPGPVMRQTHAGIHHSPESGNPAYSQRPSPGPTASNGPSELLYAYPPSQLPNARRPATSRLRNVYATHSEPEFAELSSDSAVTPPIVSAQKPLHPPRQHLEATSKAQQQGNQQPGSARQPAASSQQLEDDLRRVLKLDLVTRG